MLEVGLTGQETELVTTANTAKSFCSGALDVFATPAMISLMERTCRFSVQPFLEEGMSTVGTAVNVKHVASSPVGATITCKSKLIEIDRRRLVFEVECFDGAGIIGTGTHERFIIDSEKFQAKANAKEL